MQIKMIVTDLDRTLLRTDKTISDYTIKVLGRCRKYGIKVVFATARPRNRIDILPFTGLADAVVVSNGSAIYKNHERMMQFGIPAATAKYITRTIYSAFPHLRLSCEYDNVTYHDKPFDDGLWEGTVRIGLDDLPDLPADKIVVRAGERDYFELQKLLPENCYSQLCENRLILIMHKAATKWNAVQFLSAHFCLSTTNVIAFGDDYNDIEMLQKCGVGVAVSNALAEAKNAADYICATNDEDGAANWIEQHILAQT